MSYIDSGPVERLRRIERAAAELKHAIRDERMQGEWLPHSQRYERLIRRIDDHAAEARKEYVNSRMQQGAA